MLTSRGCLIEDPVSRRRLPRNYVETLERRVAYLENILRHSQDDFSDNLNQTVHPNFLTSPASVATGPHDDRSSGNADTQTVEDLASKVGTLSLNAAGAEPHYLGSSSTFAFARLLKPALDQIALEPSSTLQSQSSLLDSVPTTCPLPDYETAISLSNAFFENIYTQYPFLHEPTFRAWESAILLSLQPLYDPDFNPVPYYFLNMVCH